MPLIFNETPIYKNTKGIGCNSLRVLNLGIRGRREVRFMANCFSSGWRTPGATVGVVHSWSGWERKIVASIGAVQFTIYYLIIKKHIDCSANIAFYSKVLGFFSGIKQTGREIDHSLPSGAGAQNLMIYKSTSSICLRTVHSTIRTVLPLNKTYTIHNTKRCVQQLWLIFYHFVWFHYNNIL